MIPKDREKRLSAGTMLQSRFEVLREIARGGTAVVYGALDHRSGQEVAVKVVTLAANGPDTEDRYANEARLGKSLAGHPHIVRSLECGKLDGPPGFEGRMFLVTDLIDGEPLDDVLAPYGKGLPIARACAIASDVARALIGLHAQGIVHRDIKPGNVLVTGLEGDEHAQLIDFGFAYATGDGWEPKSPDLTQEGHAPGTPLYMSPQQVVHERPTPAFDIYSFGILLYELLCGNPPNHRVPQGVLLARTCDPDKGHYPIARLRRELPPHLAQLVDQCIAFESERRPCALAALAVLDGSWASTTSSTPVDAVPAERDNRLTVRTQPAPQATEVAADAPQRAAEARTRTSQRRRAPWAAAGLIVLGLGAALAWSLAPASFVGPRVDSAARTAESGPVAQAPAAPMHHAAAHVRATDTPSEAAPGPAAAAAAAAGTERAPQPPVTPRKNPRPNAPPGPNQVKPKPAQRPQADPCEARRALANKAWSKSRWGAVLTHTKNAACWSGIKAEREQLRVEALMRLGRFKACAKEAFKSKDSTAQGWGEDCYRRAEDSASEETK